MLVCVHNLHKLADGNCQINRNEKLLPCWPTIRPGLEFPEVTASASSRPTIPGSWGRQPFSPCPPNSRCRDIQSIQRADRLSGRWNNSECCNTGSSQVPLATRLHDIFYTRQETPASP